MLLLSFLENESLSCREKLSGEVKEVKEYPLIIMFGLFGKILSSLLEI